MDIWKEIKADLYQPAGCNAFFVRLAGGRTQGWVAYQMDHTNTKVLFETYSRFVPNLVRQDGSVFEKLLNSVLDTEGEG